MKRLFILIFCCLLGVNMNAGKPIKQLNKACQLYFDGKYSQASKVFEAVFESDGNYFALYSAGCSARLAGDYRRAAVLFERCISGGYYEDGDVYFRLAECFLNENDKENALAALETGWADFPQNQQILLGLINFYVTNGDVSEELIALLRLAQGNDPGYASLYYMEGNVHSALGNYEEAIAAYEKSNEVDPAFEYGLIGIGTLHYDRASDLYGKIIAEEENADYEILLKEFRTSLEAAIEPLEKAFRMTSDEDLKVSIAKRLVSIFGYFKEDDERYNEVYEKYAGIAAESQY